jgi:hypothetical protein
VWAARAGGPRKDIVFLGSITARLAYKIDIGLFWHFEAVGTAYLLQYILIARIGSRTY